MTRVWTDGCVSGGAMQVIYTKAVKSRVSGQMVVFQGELCRLFIRRL